MRTLAKVIHVLSLGLWFGSSVFFLIVTLLVLTTWKNIGNTSMNDRPPWLPISSHFTEESGTRIFGATVAPIFPIYFALQGLCGFLALLTAMTFTRIEPSRRLHRARFYVILLGLVTVFAGWPLSQKIGELRTRRYDADAAVAQAARDEFAQLHNYSLMLNFGTIVLSTLAMGLAAKLPNEPNKN